MSVKSATESNAQACFPESPEAQSSSAATTQRACAPARPAPAGRAASGKGVQDQVERLAAKENDRSRSPAGALLENAIGSELEKMPAGSKVTMDLAEQVYADKLGIPATAKGKLSISIERTGDGKFLASIGAGMGAGGALKMKTGVSVEQTLNGELTASYRFGSKEEAADKLAALSQAALTQLADIKYGPAGGFVAGRVFDGDVNARVLKTHAQNCTSIEAAVWMNIEASVSVPPAKGSLSLSPRASLKIDFDENTVTIDRKVTGAAKLTAGLKEAAAPVSFSMGTTLANLKMEGSLSLRDTHAYRGEGLLEIAGKVAEEPQKREVIARVRGQIALLDFEAAHSSPLENLGGPNGLLDLSDCDFTVKLSKPGFELGGEVDFEVAKAEAKVKYEYVVVSGKASRQFKLRDIPGLVQEASAGEARDQAMVEGLRALGR